MSDTSKDSFESAITDLIKADPKNNAKGGALKKWVQNAFDCEARVSHTTEDKALGNRVSEQFRHKAPIVVFVCREGLNLTTLRGHIDSHAYPELNSVLIMYDKEPYQYFKLLEYRKNEFSNWADQNLGVEIEHLDEVKNTEAQSVLEPSIANYLTKHDDEDLSSEELVKIFQRAYNVAKKGEQGTIANLYGILYAPHIEDFPKNGENSIAEMALGKGRYGSMGDEIGRGMSIGIELRKHIQKQKNLLRSISITAPSNYSHYLAALRTKPFMLLAGISGTGKSRIVRKLAQSCVTEELQRQYDSRSIGNVFNRWQLHKPVNFELIQVKPNWHNSLEVVGYKSNIGGAHYEFTPFVRFIARAWQHQDVPFFLCLDEMNLAPVEQYFAEFLSAIESRSFENNEYETDPIIKPFEEYGEEVCKQMLDELIGKVDASNIKVNSIENKLKNRFRTKGLTLPKNLFVLGTVNMDETTFSFSRKVLDRAMSIVMNDVAYDKFFSGESEDDMEEMTSDIMQMLINRDVKGVEAEGNDSEVVETYLSNINRVLDNTPFKLGYRAANEALLYVSATHLMTDNTTEQALDEFTMMKILSRIEGDKRSVGSILSNLATCITETYPKSYKKLLDMEETLKAKQFVSYWS